MVIQNSRRRFLYGVSASVTLLPALHVQASQSSVSLVGAAEPGERLIVRGTLLGLDGRPLQGVTLSVYHTDAAGYYSRPVSDPRRARIRGSVVTDAAGRYEFRTILPGHYADRPAERHIHTHVAVDGPVRIQIEGSPRFSASCSSSTWSPRGVATSRSWATSCSSRARRQSTFWGIVSCM